MGTNAMEFLDTQKFRGFAFLFGACLRWFVSHQGVRCGYGKISAFRAGWVVDGYLHPTVCLWLPCCPPRGLFSSASELPQGSVQGGGGCLSLCWGGCPA